MYQIQIPRFEGPLHLLLKLIEEDDLDITEIALAQVTDQYLSYLQNIEDTHPEELADFLVVASQLLLLKSRVLVPYLEQEEEESTDDLAKRLRMYKEFVVLAEKIEKRLRDKQFVYCYDKLHYPMEAEFVPPQGLNPEKLQSLFCQVLEKLKPVWQIPKATLEKTVSLAEKVRELREVLTQRMRLGFSDVLKMAHNRTEVVVSFMALLELIKAHDVTVQQKYVFSDIEIQNIKK